MNKVLVTGAAGFIGFHVAKKLLEDGEEVVGVDNLSPYYDVELKKCRIDILKQQENFSFINININNSSMLDLFRVLRVKKVIHLAAQPGVRYSVNHPFECVDNNICAFIHVLDACRNCGINKLVYASSSSVYGDTTKTPSIEWDSVDNPASLYAATKICNEVLAKSYNNLYGLNATGLRFFTVYGPWGRPDMSYWKWTEAISKGEAIELYNSGEMWRSFSYIDDIVEGTIAASNENISSEIINIGAKQSEKISTVVRVIAETLGKEAIIENLPMQQGDVKITNACINKAKRVLGYNPKITIEQGIPLFVNWYNDWNSRRIDQ